ncbi:MAG: O-antigen ligase family protein [Bacteroidales bacterium]
MADRDVDCYRRPYQDHPVTGVGAGNWKIAVYPYYGRFQPSVYRHWRNTHNDFLQISAEKGLGGFVLFVFTAPSYLWNPDLPKIN